MLMAVRAFPLAPHLGKLMMSIWGCDGIGVAEGLHSADGHCLSRYVGSQSSLMAGLKVVRPYSLVFRSFNIGEHVRELRGDLAFGLHGGEPEVVGEVIYYTKDELCGHPCLRHRLAHTHLSWTIASMQ